MGRFDRAEPPPGTIFNHNKPPHVVSVTVFKVKIPVVFGHEPQMRVQHLGNVMVYYDVTEGRVVAQALGLLGGSGGKPKHSGLDAPVGSPSKLLYESVTRN